MKWHCTPDCEARLLWYEVALESLAVRLNSARVGRLDLLWSSLPNWHVTAPYSVVACFAVGFDAVAALVLLSDILDLEAFAAQIIGHHAYAILRVIGFVIIGDYRLHLAIREQLPQQQAVVG